MRNKKFKEMLASLEGNYLEALQEHLQELHKQGWQYCEACGVQFPNEKPHICRSTSIQDWQYPKPAPHDHPQLLGPLAPRKPTLPELLQSEQVFPLTPRSIKIFPGIPQSGLDYPIVTIPSHPITIPYS